MSLQELEPQVELFLTRYAGSDVADAALFVAGEASDMKSPLRNSWCGAIAEIHCLEYPIGAFTLRVLNDILFQTKGLTLSATLRVIEKVKTMFPVSACS